jgi:hypothetical protein
MVPDKKILNDIWKNKGRINESLAAISSETLDEDEYWSSTEYKGSAAVYQLFDDEGKADHTTKDHEFSIIVIREWTKD